MARKSRNDVENTNVEEFAESEVVDLSSKAEPEVVPVEKVKLSVQAPRPAQTTDSLEARVAELERALAIVMIPITTWSFCEVEDEKFIRAYSKKLRDQLGIQTYDRKY